MQQHPPIPARESEIRTVAHALDPRRLITSAFSVLGRVRQGRVFHPNGLLLDGELTARSTGALPFPSGTHPVIARLSKGAGTPGGLPDILGLAFRLSPAEGRQPWDITLASSGAGTLSRVLLVPSRSWSQTVYSSLMPYRVGNRWLWLLAEADNDQPSDTADLSALERQARNRPLHFTLFQAAPGQGRKVIGHLTLHGVRGDAEFPAFDPVQNCPPDVHLSPDWINRIRELSYRGSRAGRSSG